MEAKVVEDGEGFKREERGARLRAYQRIIRDGLFDPDKYYEKVDYVSAVLDIAPRGVDKPLDGYVQGKEIIGDLQRAIGDLEDYEGLKTRFYPPAYKFDPMTEEGEDKSLIGHYHREITQYPLIPSENEHDLFRFFLIAFKYDSEKVSTEVRNFLIASNLGLAVSVAKRFAKDEESLEELTQEGNMELLRKIHKYDPLTGNKFSTFMYWCLQNHFLKVSRKDKEHSEHYSELDEENNDVPVENSPLRNISRDEKVQMVRRAMDNLSWRERFVITNWHKHSFEGCDSLNGPQLAKRLNVSREMIRLIRESAYEKLKKTLEPLSGYDFN